MVFRRLINLSSSVYHSLLQIRFFYHRRTQYTFDHFHSVSFHIGHQEGIEQYTPKVLRFEFPLVSHSTRTVHKTVTDRSSVTLSVSKLDGEGNEGATRGLKKFKLRNENGTNSNMKMELELESSGSTISRQ